MINSQCRKLEYQTHNNKKHKKESVIEMTKIESQLILTLEPLDS